MVAKNHMCPVARRRGLGSVFPGLQQNRNLYCGLAPQRGEHRGSKVTDVYPGVTDVYRNGLLHVISRGSRTVVFTLLANDSSSAGLYCKLVH